MDTNGQERGHKLPSAWNEHREISGPSYESWLSEEEGR